MKLSLKIIIFFSLSISITSYSQNNTLSGNIFDDGEVLSYVNIYLKKNKLGTASDDNGFYEIKNIPMVLIPL